MRTKTKTKTKRHSTAIGARWQVTDPRLTGALEAFEAVVGDTDAAQVRGRRLLVDGRVLIDLSDEHAAAV